mgnify:FL=1
MVGGLLDSFPDGYTPNSSQVKLLKNIDQAFSDGHKFVVCNAPTGSGKSFISKTLANVSQEPSCNFKDLITSYTAFKIDQTGSYTHEAECEEEASAGAFALTITKALQDQYKDLFDDVTILKGKRNYASTIDSNIDVELESLIMPKSILEDHRRRHKCPYHNDRRDALINKFAALNYNMFFSLPNHIKKRQYLICDEAAELEDQLVKEFSCDINFEMLKRMDILVRPFYSKNTANVIQWINNLLLDLNDKIDELRDIISTNTNNKKFLVETRRKIVGMRNLHSKLSLIIDTWNDSEYLFETNKEGINFMPLKVNNLSDHLFKYADKVILMSATIIDPANFCKTLGIDKFKYVEADSTFDPSNSPIFCNTKNKLNYHNLKRTLPKIIKQVEGICAHHKDDKGIIHTHNNTITSFLQKKLNGERFLIREPGVRNEEILEQHLASDKPTVLISPSMSHGVDLKDDLARFQIIIKAPYLPTKDKRIERLMKDDFNWYSNKMLCSVIQSCGRGIRSKKDYCRTYILDGAIVESVINNIHKLPKYFIDRFV